MGIVDELFPKARPETAPRSPSGAAQGPQAGPQAPQATGTPETPQKRSFPQRAYEWLVPRGPEGIRQVEHKDFGFMHEIPAADMPAMSKEAFRTGTGLMFARDVEAQANVVRQNLGVDVQYDKFGHPFFKWKGKGYYVNPPGLQQGDLNQLAGQVLGYAGAGRAASAGAGSTLGRMTRVGLGEGAYSVGEDKLGDVFGADQGVSGMKAAFAGLGGALFEGLAPIVVRKWQGILGDRRYIDRASGTLTNAGKAAARRAGLNPDDMTRRMREAFAREAETARAGIPGQGDLESAAGYAQGDEFGIPYTRGQAAGDYDQLAREESMRKSAIDGGEVMREFDRTQAQAINEAAGRVQDDIAGGARTVERPRDAGDNLRETTVAREATDRAEVDAAYQDARTPAPMSGGIPRMEQASVLGVGDVPALRRIVNGKLSQTTFDPELTPRAVRSNEIVSRFIETARKSQNRRVSPFTIRKMETDRRRLNLQIEGAQTPTDRRAATMIRDGFDEWWDRAIDAELMSGDPTKWNVLKQARKTAASYHKKYSKQGRRDPAGNVVERILQDNPTGEQVVNWVFGNSMLRADGNSVAVVKRLKEIGGDDAAQQLRELAWVKLTMSKSGQRLPPARIKRNIDEAFESAGSLMDELFPERELQALMRRYGEAVGRTVPPEGIVNTSNSANVILRTLNGMIGRAGSGATMGGNPMMGTALWTTKRLTEPGKASASRAKKMVTRPRRRVRPNPALTGAVSAGSGEYGGGLLDLEQYQPLPY